nr:MAG TPA: hypothetical protein [Caudoviricetes sp.]
MKNSFKIRVKEILNGGGEECFGEVGNIFKIKDGQFFDLDGYKWSNDGEGFENVEQVNDYFGENKDFGAKFELVEESSVIIDMTEGKRNPKDYIKTGVVLEFANGERYLALNNFCFNQESWITFSRYNDDLIHCYYNEFNIDKIYSSNQGDLSFMLTHTKEVLWERNPKRKLTKEEAEKEFDIEIID